VVPTTLHIPPEMSSGYGFALSEAAGLADRGIERWRDRSLAEPCIL